MIHLILGLVIFMGVHVVPTVPAWREGLVGRLGEGGYKGVFSVLSLICLGLIVWGFGDRVFVPLWDPPQWTRHVAFLLMIPAFILLAAAYIPSRIRTFMRHPMLTALKTWALAHLLANGDLGSVLLFGAFLAFAVYDRISVKRRAGGGLGPLGEAKGGVGGDIAAVSVGLAAYAFMLLWGHEHLIGMPLLGVIAVPS